MAALVLVHDHSCTPRAAVLACRWKPFALWTVRLQGYLESLPTPLVEMRQQALAASRFDPLLDSGRRRDP